MTRWGFALLFVYVALGLSPTPWRKAGRLAVLLTLAVLGFVMAKTGALR
jgi:hypothetical protein